MEKIKEFEVLSSIALIGIRVIVIELRYEIKE